MNPPRPYLLAETNWATVRETDYSVAILPWGATEAHNYHLPYATDNIQAEGVAARAAALAWERNAKVIVLPCIPFGVNTGQLDIKLCMNLNPSTQLAILRDVVDVLDRHGIRKLVLFNGHGGNDFKSMIRELSFYYPEVFTCWLNWYQAADWHAFFAEPGDHAGEMETSMVLHLAPELVRPLEEAGPGKAREFKIEALRKGWVRAQRQWTAVTSDTGVGNPHRATAEKGARYFEACALAIADFLVELANTEIADLYE